MHPSGCCRGSFQPWRSLIWSTGPGLGPGRLRCFQGRPLPRRPQSMRTVLRVFLPLLLSGGLKVRGHQSRPGSDPRDASELLMPCLPLAQPPIPSAVGIGRVDPEGDALWPEHVTALLLPNWIWRHDHPTGLVHPRASEPPPHGPPGHEGAQAASKTSPKTGLPSGCYPSRSICFAGVWRISMRSTATSLGCSPAEAS